MQAPWQKGHDDSATEKSLWATSMTQARDLPWPKEPLSSQTTEDPHDSPHLVPRTHLGLPGTLLTVASPTLAWAPTPRERPRWLVSQVLAWLRKGIQPAPVSPVGLQLTLVLAAEVQGQQGAVWLLSTAGATHSLAVRVSHVSSCAWLL